jgi:biopolymer transport protein ExbD
MVAITSDAILLDGIQVASVSEVMSSNQLLIPGLANELKKQRTISESVGELSFEMGFKGKISIQGDKEIPYQLLKKVMYTCGQIGYNDILLAVMKIE